MNRRERGGAVDSTAGVARRDRRLATATLLALVSMSALAGSAGVPVRGLVAAPASASATADPFSDVIRQAAAGLPPASTTAVMGPRAAQFDATIRRTEYGIPHITAPNFAGLGFGVGYAMAQDNICVLANDYITVDGQRSRYFGPDGTYLQGGNGFSSTNLDSDIFWQQIIDSHAVENLLAIPPPEGMRPELHDLARGTVAGWNRYLADIGGPSGITDPACRGAAWVHPLSEIEGFRRLYQLMILASQGVDITGIAEAQPPALSLGSSSGAAAVDPAATAKALGARLHTAIGSNAVAIGRDGTRDHTHGLLLGNPHFPWYGTERFYEAQLTIPGVLNVEGSMLYGVPMVLIGHTQNMAWSHTVSTAFRFTPYELTLVPGFPTTYLLDGKPTAMTRRTVTVQVRGAGGQLTPVSRTLWSTRYGPVISSIVGVPLPWTPVTAFAMRDAIADNVRAFNHFVETDQAQSVAQELAILKKYQGIPWVNTIVADRAGNALYADIGVVPHVTDAQAQQCDTALGLATFTLLGLPILDGSRTACDWGTDPDAAEPGLFGPSHLPYLLRSDYVTNSNDSYWLSNPHQPLTGFARIIGAEGTERSLRTRLGLMMTQQRIDGTDGLGPPGFTRQDMQSMDLGDRVLAAELTRDSLVGVCRRLPLGLAPTTTGAPVAVGNACDVLHAWDLHTNLDSRGALLFRRFWDHVTANTTEASAVGVPDWPAVFMYPFNSADGVNTPNTLNPLSPIVITALGDAISDLRGAHIALDATVGSQQGVHRNGAFIPIHGGLGDPDGVFNAIYAPFTPGSGFGDVQDGSSFIQVVTWHDATGCPDVANILSYSLSASSASAHAADQTSLFSAKQWVTERYCAADVAAHTITTTALTQ
jgi:acyl-homoserine-lactone acylase